MPSFRIEERVTDKNCSVTDLKRGVALRCDISLLSLQLGIVRDLQVIPPIKCTPSSTGSGICKKETEFSSIYSASTQLKKELGLFSLLPRGRGAAAAAAS